MHDDVQCHEGLRILVVDDNEDAASSMSALLEFEGHRTSTAHNGLEAVREASRVRYDAILLDLNMPVLDGFQAAALLGQLQPAPALIAWSAWDDAEACRRTAELGFSTHLRKPVPFQMVKEALRDVSAYASPNSKPAPVRNMNAWTCPRLPQRQQ